ncbi:MAG TPA: CpsD/CapB family tyrosine-protein kinase [Terriglobales bacterium]|nr:CpsD/CapB family tyrosine-protein kinase [Terriglobales bacterium]
MSRNFELLSEAGRMHELVQQPLEPGLGAVAPAAVAPRLVEDDFSPAAALEMSEPVRDEIGKLVQKLFLAAQGPRRVVFAGTEPGAGCSWMIARVAESLAAQGRGSVCVVDCNLRSPGLHEQFGSENHHGLSDALAGTSPIREYVRRWSRHLWYLSCGAESEAGQSLLGSDRMRMRLAEMKTVFDFVLIDASPLNVCNDAIVLGGLTDGVVLLLKANASRREAARKALHDLESANVKVLGAVLNQRTFPIPEKLYKKL